MGNLAMSLIGVNECKACWGSGETQYWSDGGALIFEPCTCCSGVGYFYKEPPTPSYNKNAIQKAVEAIKPLLKNYNKK